MIFFLVLSFICLGTVWIFRYNKANYSTAPILFRDLINYEPELVISEYLKIIRKDESNVDAYLSLAQVFREQGDYQQSIGMHKNLLSRENLSKDNRNLIYYELAKDYFSAGLYDRAEYLFMEIYNNVINKNTIILNLIKIYEINSDWNKATDFYERLAYSYKSKFDKLASHYYCEQAKLNFLQGKKLPFFELVNKAIDVCNTNVRPIIMLGDHFYHNKDLGRARFYYEQVLQEHANYTSLILEQYLKTYSEQEFISALKKLPPELCNISISIIVKSRTRTPEINNFIDEKLKQNPNSLLLALSLQNANAPDYLEDIIEQETFYICNNCGFKTKSFLWKCDQCCSWDSIQAC